MIKVKDLALVWGDKDSPLIIIPLREVTQEIYDCNTKWLGLPKGRTETFINGFVERNPKVFHELFS